MYSKAINKTLVATSISPEVAVPQNTSHIWIFDRSGSMYYELPKLIEDMVTRLNVLKPGDTISIGWFSSIGEYRWFVVNHLFGEHSRDSLEAAIRDKKHTVGATCFSEILNELAENVFNEIKQFAPDNNVVLTFFTDGYPVVPHPIPEEYVRVAAALSRVQTDKALFVGYGFYNREMMLLMQDSATNGVFVHANNLDQVNEVTTAFIESDTIVEVRPEHQTPDNFIIENGLVIPIKVTNGVARVPSSTAFLYTLVDGKHSEQDIDGGLHYALAAYLYRKDIAHALQVLGEIGDVYMIDGVNNSFLDEERAHMDYLMQKAIYESNTRFIDGYQANYVPYPNAFCVLDVLYLLTQSEVYFYPFHQEFRYERTGRKQEIDGDYPRFIFLEEDTDRIKYPISDLVYNKGRANVSIRVKVPGYVTEPDGRQHFCDVFRNYSIISDGRVKTHRWVISSDEDLWTALNDRDLVESSWVNENTPYIINLIGLPVANNNIMTGNLDIGNYVRLVKEANDLEFKLKAFRHVLKVNQPEGIDLTSSIPEELQLKLAELGIKNGTYSPPRKPLEALDFYQTREISYSVVGMSIPSVSTVLNKAELTPREYKLYGAIAEADKLYRLNGLVGVKAEIERLQYSLHTTRSYLFETNFSIIVGHNWFNGVPMKDTTNHDGVKITLKNVQVPI